MAFGQNPLNCDQIINMRSFFALFILLPFSLFAQSGKQGKTVASRNAKANTVKQSSAGFSINAEITEFPDGTLVELLNGTFFKSFSFSNI